ncbi:MAG TPA: response regulator [Bryobacteraceae bacterium]|nr:response regulator [Bryobacteraceae bacterium]HTF61759.1 response regulator [Edaphobacter sp.]
MDSTVSSNSFNREDLAGKRIAIIGYSPEEAAPFQKILDGADAFCRVLSPQDADGTGLRAFDVAILRLDESEVSPLLDDKEATHRVPFLLVGSSGAIQKNLAAARDKSTDFLLKDAWSPDELMLRALKLLSTNSQPKKSGAQANGKQTVVIADDDSSITTLLNMTLKKAGFDIHIARDGGEAVEVAKKVRPDLMIIDINMPYRDGFEVLTILRQNPDTAFTKVLMLTASEQEVDVLRGFGLGADDYVIKPFNPMEISARVKSLLARAQ